MASGLRKPATKYGKPLGKRKTLSGQPPPPLFNFRAGELEGAPPELRARILPPHMR